MTLADRVYAALPPTSEQALSPAQIANKLHARPCDVSAACRQLRKWWLVDFRAGVSSSRRPCLLWWKIA